MILDFDAVFRFLAATVSSSATVSDSDVVETWLTVHFGLVVDDSVFCCFVVVVVFFWSGLPKSARRGRPRSIGTTPPSSTRAATTVVCAFGICVARWRRRRRPPWPRAAPTAPASPASRRIRSIRTCWPPEGTLPNVSLLFCFLVFSRFF